MSVSSYSKLKRYLHRSRVFMRLQSDKVRLVTFDEPTSALDPQGAKDMLHRFRMEQKGRTMIMATHNYEHLTKYADLIM